MNSEIDILLARYFSGEASDKDMELLDDWLAQSEENESYFEKMTMIFEKSAMVEPPVFDTKKAFGNFKEYINSEPQKKAKRKYIGFYKYTAVAAVAILLVGLFYFLTVDNKPVTITADKFTQHTLPSGVIVSLDSAAIINYTEENNVYTVKLEGKAHFNVVENDKKQLLVLADNTIIKDIGTEFTVTAFPEDREVIVEVESGKVHFYTEEQEGLLMDAGTKAIYDKLEKTFSFINTAPVIFDFNAATLNEVISRLSSQFNVNIVLADASLSSLMITTYFENEPIDNIFDIIAETLSLKVSKEKDVYILSK